MSGPGRPRLRQTMRQHGANFAGQPNREAGLREERVAPCCERTLPVGFEGAPGQHDNRRVMRALAVSQTAHQFDAGERTRHADGGHDDVSRRGVDSVYGQARGHEPMRITDEPAVCQPSLS